MGKEINFRRIHNQNIFQPEFEDLTAQNHGKIAFKKMNRTSGGIAVVYAPNGTGKTSFTQAVSAQASSEKLDFSAEYEGNLVGPENQMFQIIGDQMTRNIIPGKTSDYLIGPDIKQEYDLREMISEGFSQAFEKDFPNLMKERFRVTKKTDQLILNVANVDRYASECISDLVNRQSRGKGIDRDNFISYLSEPKHRRPVNETLEEGKRAFLLEDYAGDKLIDQLLQTDIESMIAEKDVEQIEQDDDAITIVNKYPHVHHCIVCDNPDYHAETLLARKEKSRKRVYERLDKKTRILLDQVKESKKITGQDPFEIKKIVIDFIATGEKERFLHLLNEFKVYREAIANEMVNALLDIFDDSDMLQNYTRCQELKNHIPEIKNEEFLLIQEVIRSNIDADITVERDESDDKNFKLMLKNRPLLGEKRENMELSTGEQNFISLAFELLLARNSDKEIIVIDDPISSFDSVYKNKIAYCILKFLEEKQQIILTHNTDLIHLLNVQMKGSFNLYILVNEERAENGFIPVSEKERDILINLHDLIALLRNGKGELENIVLDKRHFLMSMIPFMRGYAHILTTDDKIYSKLSELMHGYTNATEDVAAIYEELFGYHFEKEEVSTEDVLHVNYEPLRIVDKEEYPLLAETLKQTLAYYHLRMKVEKELVDTFHICIKPGEVFMLSDLIRRAFSNKKGITEEEKNKNLKYRVFFTSRKTLINEFNHFEGNMNLFQPAIDITPAALKREVQDITGKLVSMKEDFPAVT